MVLQRGQGVVFHGEYGKLRVDAPLYMASISKLFAAGILMRLHDAKILDIEAPISRYGFGQAGEASVSVAQLISNSGGLPCLVDALNPAPFRCQYREQATLIECGQAIWAAHRPQRLQRPPDREFCYGGAQWQLAAAVAEKVTGRSWTQLYQETYGACGLSGRGFSNPFADLAALRSNRLEYPKQETPNATRNPNIEAGLWVPPSDVAKVLQMHLEQGRCGDAQVLSSRSVARMQADRIAEVYQGEIRKGMSEFFLEPFGRGYGLGWWVRRDTQDRVVPGAFGSTAWIRGDQKYAAIAVTRSDGVVGRDLFVAIKKVLDQEP